MLDDENLKDKDDLLKEYLSRQKEGLKKKIRKVINMFLLSIFYLVGENCRFTYWFIIEASYLDSTINWTGFTYLIGQTSTTSATHGALLFLAFVLVIGLGIIAVYLSPLLAVGLFIFYHLR